MRVAASVADRPTIVEVQRGRGAVRTAGASDPGAEYIVYGVPSLQPERGPIAIGVLEVFTGAGSATLSAQVRSWFHDHAYYGDGGAARMKFQRLFAVRGTAVAFL